MCCSNCICIPDSESGFWKSSFYQTPNGFIKCSCGESSTAMETLTCAQHDRDCDLMKAFNEWAKLGAIV